ncbi:hypothetical protein [Anabaena subtropica]|nr:hypothetical protein [Anabaena subtropica]
MVELVRLPPRLLPYIISSALRGDIATGRCIKTLMSDRLYKGMGVA